MFKNILALVLIFVLQIQFWGQQLNTSPFSRYGVGEINDILILNGSIIMFSNNGYMIEYDTKGNIKKLSKLVKNIFSNIIVVDGNLFFLDKNIRLIKLS